MKQLLKYCFTALSTFLIIGVHGQGIYTFSGSDKVNNSNFNFYNPLIIGSQTFSHATISSGPFQILNDTTTTFDTTLQTYDIDSIPEQLVIYNSPCRFYVKSDSLDKVGTVVTGSRFYIIDGHPLGTIQFNRLNQFQYLTHTDTLDFSLRFALITSMGDTIKSKTSVKFKIIPTLPNESATFGFGSKRGLPDPAGSEFRIQTIDTSTVLKTFNFRRVNLRKVSYSGVTVILQKDLMGDQLHLLDGASNIDTLNIYAETLVIRGGFTLPGTTVIIYAKELIFEDLNNNSAYINTTPLPPFVQSTGRVGDAGQRGGDIHLHILKFSGNPGKRFILNGGDGEDSDQKIGAGGNGGDLYSTINLSNYMVSEGGYSGNKKYNSDVTYKGTGGHFLFDSSYASWLHPNFLNIIKSYYKEGFYAGNIDAVVNNLKYYTDILETYIASDAVERLPESVVIQLSQISDEINQIFYNISNNLDYYGNPPGWVPMLSFEVSKAAYTSQVTHALNVLFLDHLVQNANNNLLSRQAAFTQLRAEAQTIVLDNKNQYEELAFTVIPDIKNNIQANQERISQLKQTLAQLDNELNQRAEKKYNDRKTWKWVGVAGKVLSAIPTPYTMAAGAAISAGTQIFGTDDQKIGYGQGAAFAGAITTTLEPFTSGQVTNQVSTLGQNVSGGVSSIFSQIGSINSLDDVKQVANDSKKLYDDNKAMFQSVAQSVTGVVNLFNSITRVNGDELGSIKGELIANEPRIGILAEEMKNVADDQQRLGHQLETSTQEMLSSRNNVYSGLTAISHFNDEVFDGASAYDHTLSVFSYDMRRKAFERLRKYHYYMLKAYEYRTIDTTLGSLWELNLTNTLLKVDAFVNASQTSLTTADISSLKSIYDEEIHKIAEKIYDYYQANQAGKTATSKLRLSNQEIKDINLGKTITINLVEKGLFSPDKEDLRISNLQVSKAVIRPVVNGNTGLYDQVEFKFDYPNYSRIKKSGMIYSFNNYNLHTEQPINWGTSYDLYSQSLTPIVTSDASKSLLSNLFEGTSGAGKVDLFARPAAWADIKLSMKHTTDGRSIVNLDSLFIDVQYDFQYKPNNIVNVEFNTNYKWFAPTFNVNTIDKYERKSGIGNIHRVYTQSTSGVVTTTAPAKYGRYIFTNWASRTGDALANSNGVDISQGNTLRFNLATDRSFKAMYKFEGAILSIPDTVYLNDSLNYNLAIKNIGAGPLLWNLDSNTNWIKPEVRSGVNDSTITFKFDRNPDSTNSRIGLLDITSTETELLHHYIYFIQNKVKSIDIYTFIGSGNWSEPTNWLNNTVPPTMLNDGQEIIINPPQNGECVLDVQQNVGNGSKITVLSNKKFRILGSLNIQQN